MSPPGEWAVWSFVEKSRSLLLPWALVQLLIWRVDKEAQNLQDMPAIDVV